MDSSALVTHNLNDALYSLCSDQILISSWHDCNHFKCPNLPFAIALILFFNVLLGFQEWFSIVDMFSNAVAAFQHTYCTKFC